MTRMTNRPSIKALLLLFLCGMSVATKASITELQTELGDNYYYTDHYEIIIDRPVAEVWPHVVALGKWMPMIAGQAGNTASVEEGYKVNIYGHFFMQVAQVVPEKMILLTNLPAEDRGEQTQGLAMVSLVGHEGKTIVSVFMSRVYFWFSEGENPQRRIRSADDFATQRRVMFHDTFLQKLKIEAETAGN